MELKKIADRISDSSIKVILNDQDLELIEFVRNNSKGYQENEIYDIADISEIKVNNSYIMPKSANLLIYQNHAEIEIVSDLFLNIAENVQLNLDILFSHDKIELFKVLTVKQIEEIYSRGYFTVDYSFGNPFIYVIKDGFGSKEEAEFFIRHWDRQMSKIYGNEVINEYPKKIVSYRGIKWK